MSRNGYHPGGRGDSVMVLYKIINSESDRAGGLYNCFQMAYGSGPTLNSIKQHCVAAHSLSTLGPEGFHFRVMMEDKPNATGERSFSWWDIQDGSAKLPVKETSQHELRKLLFPSKSSGSGGSTTDSATKAAKGAFKMMGKAMASAIGDEGGAESHGPPVSVIVVKMLDLNKIHDDYNRKHGGAPPAGPPPRARRPAPKARTPVAASRAAAPQSRARPPQRATPAAGQPRGRPAPAPAAANLMDFGDAPSAAPARRAVHHAPSAMPAAPPPNETRAQRLKREQEARMKQNNRVWDDVDQRWVEKPAAGAARSGAAAAAARPKKKEVGVKLDMSNAAGKSAKVQQAMQKRVNEMNATRQKAVAEVKQREAEKKRMEDEEDAIRAQLEPKIKAWSEEHGKKKQLQALLGSLHTILWPGTKWKPISIGDILQPAKVKKFYFKATLVVHPDKTRDLPAEQRFLAKRIFDALTQAKTIWDESQAR
ncbi:unnamed protein product [Pseudo-nitzschia multistriata]|uniref:J domain-containing protein n=1 Tax=Pseudo-nitzschia multistriata TaxID=183589 RepID=A0A448ZME7_9STRA|nr:unnamed protein product [Pseudo-nitzschia multistriata]